MEINRVLYLCCKGRDKISIYLGVQFLPVYSLRLFSKGGCKHSKMP